MRTCHGEALQGIGRHISGEESRSEQNIFFKKKGKAGKNGLKLEIFNILKDICLHNKQKQAETSFLTFVNVLNYSISLYSHSELNVDSKRFVSMYLFKHG